MKCMICGKETHGSTGAAGIFWPNMCQKCKNEEDEMLRQVVKSQNRAFAEIFQVIRKGDKSGV
jgi:hypothetical protein